MPMSMRADISENFRWSMVVNDRQPLLPLIKCVTASVPRVVMLEVVKLDSKASINLMEDFARILRGSNERVADLRTKSGIQRALDAYNHHVSGSNQDRSDA